MKYRTGFVSNSSSSSFICNTAMNVTEVTIKLRSILEHYNTITGTKYKFENVFKQPYVAPEEGAHPEWNEYYPDLKRSCNKIIIDSVDKNSIPSSLFDIIDEVFEAYRIHLG